MQHFHYVNNTLHCEGIPAETLAERYGTPLYVYSANAFRGQYRDLVNAFAAVHPLACYSVKACSNLAILKLLKDEGSGFDCVSRGEILRCLKAGADPKKIVFAGVGKTPDEIEFALNTGILMFNVESENELHSIAAVAKRFGKTASIALRLNPDVDPKTHTYITTGKRENKFGIDLARAAACLDIIKSNPVLKLKGVHLHIGSQITLDSPHAEAVRKITPFLKDVKARGFDLEYLNIGGGFGISYEKDEGLPIAAFAAKLVPAIQETELKLLSEPGRFISGNSAILLTRVIYLKRSGDKVFAVCDAAMNDLLRPSIYGAYHRVWPTSTAPKELAQGEGAVYDVVGPICESGDFLAKDRRMPALNESNLLAVFSAGAYGFAMASNYNTRPRAAEILVDGDNARVIRERETWDDLMRHELKGL